VAPDPELRAVTPPAQHFDHLPMVDGIARYTAVGTVSLTEGVDLVTAAIAYCRRNAIRELLIDVRDTRLKVPPTIIDRYWMAQDWGLAAQGQLRAAMVARAEHIDPNKFGIKACIDAGLHCDVVTTVEDAEAWLRQQAPLAGADGAA
jgi:hypothetical protein